VYRLPDDSVWIRRQGNPTSSKSLQRGEPKATRFSAKRRHIDVELQDDLNHLSVF
jgi:hypothetical protein